MVQTVILFIACSLASPAHPIHTVHFHALAKVLEHWNEAVEVLDVGFATAELSRVTGFYASDVLYGAHKDDPWRTNLVRCRGQPGGSMNFIKSAIMPVLVITLITSGTAQNVKVGYDKTVDFSQYKTYTVAEPDVQPSRPLLHASIIGSIDHELKSRGLIRAERDGDLILVPEGGAEFGLSHAAGTPISPAYGGLPPAINATMWTGAAGYASSVSSYVPEGALRIDFIDRAANKVVWSGTAKVKLDVERKSKSLELIDKSIIKLLKGFPPGRR
jgi:hypothetical protein